MNLTFVLIWAALILAGVGIFWLVIYGAPLRDPSKDDRRMKDPLSGFYQ